MNRFLLTVSGLFIFLCRNSSVWAWPPLFGPEFTFTNESIYRADYGFNRTEFESIENRRAQSAFVKVLTKRCKASKSCLVKKIYDRNGSPSFRVTYHDGVWFNISLDPAVVEVQASPMTTAEWSKNRERFEKDVFEVAKSLGLKPHSDIGGGHIHMGLESSFGGDSKLFRNFIVDFANHPELARGVLADDPANSRALADADDEVKVEFQKAIQRFDQGEIQGVRDLADEIENNVYHFYKYRNSLPAHAKYQALSFARVTDNSLKFIGKLEPHQRTVEFRAFRAQSSFDDFFKEIKLIEGRLRYIKALDHPIEFRDPRHQFTREKMESFRRYVEESGLKWEDYRTLAPDEFQNTQQFEVKVKPLSQENLEKAENALRKINQTQLLWEKRLIQMHSLKWLQEKQRCFELYQNIFRSSR